MKLLYIMGILTLVFAEGAALRQDKIKRMLAYSSIGQIGLIMIAFSFNTYLGVFAGVFIMLNHALIKSLLFLSSSFLAYNSPKKYIKDIQGFGRYMPLTAFLFAFGAFAIVGFPPFSGFWSKFYLLLAAAKSHYIPLIVLILSISIIELVYYMRVLHKLYFKEPTGEYEPHKPRWNAALAMILIAVVILAIGIYPDLVTGYIGKAAHAIMDKSAYIHNVLTAFAK
jgi:formate hydrogenlyase subunit 3/multisubunit Na+/H+ antiporter MnhD subunit